MRQGSLGGGDGGEFEQSPPRVAAGSDGPPSLHTSAVVRLEGLSRVRSRPGEPGASTQVTTDSSEAARRESGPSFLVEASRALAVNHDARETLSIVAHLTLINLADLCVAVTVDSTGSLTQVVAADHDTANAELAREMRRLFPPDRDPPGSPLRECATGKARLIPDLSDTLLREAAHDDDHLNMLRRLGARSLIIVPLRARGRALGTILLARKAYGARFSSEDLELAEGFGARAALALDNAMLHRSEQQARRDAERTVERMARLQAVTAALSEAVTPSAVADVFVRQGTAAVGASGGFVRLLTPDGRRLKLEATVGYSRQFRESYGSLPLTSPLPGAEVFRTSGERFFESAAAARTESLEFAREQAATVHEAIAFVPLLRADRPIGVLAFSFAEARTFEGDDRELMRTLANQCAQAVERARLYQKERQARTAVERAIEQSTHLQSLAADLAVALTCAEVADVVVRQGIASTAADAAALYLLSEDESTLEVVNGQGSDPGLIEGWRRLPSDANVPSTKALQSLEPVFIESKLDSVESTYARVRVGAHIPLVVSGRPVGVLFLGYTKPRRFPGTRRSFMLAFGRQCAQALSRAQLYEEALEGRSRISRLVERLQDGVISFDRHGRVVFLNSTAKRMLLPASLGEDGRAPKSWLGFPLRSFVADLFSSGEGVIEAQVVSRDDDSVFDVTGIRAERADTALVVVSDVSDRERRQRVEREFVANAAHELRTPLAAITSSIERLQAGAREIPAKRDRYLDHIQHESARLNRLASSLLVLARAQAREEEPRCEEIAIRTLLKEIVGEIEVSPEVELILDCPHELIARCNRDLLEHVVLNLVSNAARHTSRGSIRLRGHMGNHASVVIEVADTGAGIAPEDLKRIFDRFYRGSGGQGRPGFGLGLPIAKEAVTAIGGSLEIESDLGHGTIARVVLPGAPTPDLA
jgi:signal transduction histidine kinase/transcriptional regulator with GAF, ATPase, and Fis domain